MEKDITLIDQERLRRDEARVKRDFWPKVKRFAGRVPFLPDLLAAYYCAIDPRSPLQAKATLMAALAYFILPTDLIPDLFALFGFADDAAVLLAALRSLNRHISPEHRAKAAAALGNVTS